MKLVINKVQYVSLVSCKAQLLENLWDRERPARRFGRMVLCLEKVDFSGKSSSECEIAMGMVNCRSCEVRIRGSEAVRSFGNQISELLIKN